MDNRTANFVEPPPPIVHNANDRARGRQPSPKNTRKPRSSSRQYVFIGFDSEYTERAAANSNNEIGEVKKKNHVLSYQIYGITPTGSWEGFVLVDDNRWTFRDLVKWAVERGKECNAFKHRPAEVYLCAHFSRADITTLKDFDQIVRQLDCCRNTFTTMRFPVKVTYSDNHHNNHEINVHLRDSWLLAPEGKQGLDSIGALMQIPKVEIEGYDKRRMDILLEKSPELFERYAVTDPKISAHYVKKITEFAEKLWDQDGPPITIGGCATNFTLHTWAKNKIDMHAVLGTRIERVKYFKRSQIVVELHPKRALYEQHAVRAYAGGRNEAFYYGITPESGYVDYDLRGAYTMALAFLGIPKWDELEAVFDIANFSPDVIGFGHVLFKFPPETRFPCLPVRVPSGLIFPLEGESFATAPEIYLARTMGAELTLKDGCLMPMDFSVRPFVATSKKVAELRQEYREKFEPKSLMELFIKTVGNSIYGKLAQAVRPRRVFNTRSMALEDLEPSKITNPFIAAAVTGLIRAVLGEILTRIPKDARVLSVTTDGFLCDVPEDQMPSLCNGPICKLFSETRRLIGGDSDILEIKHRANQVIVWRTRSAVTVVPDDGVAANEVILARGGHTRLRNMDAVTEADAIVERFISREHGKVTTWESLRGVRDICENGGDMVSVIRKAQHTMDFDLRRLPMNIGERPIKKHPHLCFDTRPVPNAVEFERVRAAWKDYYQRYQRPLKRSEDWKSFVEFAAVVESGKTHVPREQPAVFVAKKSFLTAYVRAEWGLNPKLSNKELAEVLTAGGYKTEVHEVENAKRPKAVLHEHCVHETPRVREFLTFVQLHFPGFDEHKLLAQGPSSLT